MAKYVLTKEEVNESSIFEHAAVGWNRGTIGKGLHELESGMVCINAFSSRGRKRAEDHLPNLLSDITAIVDGQSQADPQFRTTRLYTRLTAAEVRRQLMVQKGCHDDALTTAETIATKLNDLGYYPKKVAKSQPQKTAETDAIFAQVKQINEEADADEQVLRISIDAKAAVKVGPFARGGRVASQPRLPTMIFSRRPLSHQWGFSCRLPTNSFSTESPPK
jgi:Rhodopirellula transposase DDE domain